MHTNPSSGTYRLDSEDANGGEKLEMIAVSTKPFRELSCNSNIRTNLDPESNRKIKIVCVKLRDNEVM